MLSRRITGPAGVPQAAAAVLAPRSRVLGAAAQAGVGVHGSASAARYPVVAHDEGVWAVVFVACDFGVSVPLTRFLHADAGLGGGTEHT